MLLLLEGEAIPIFLELPSRTHGGEVGRVEVSSVGGLGSISTSKNKKAGSRADARRRRARGAYESATKIGINEFQLSECARNLLLKKVDNDDRVSISGEQHIKCGYFWINFAWRFIFPMQHPCQGLRKYQPWRTGEHQTPDEQA